jgi:hypothetical protein
MTFEEWWNENVLLFSEGSDLSNARIVWNAARLDAVREIIQIMDDNYGWHYSWKEYEEEVKDDIYHKYPELAEPKEGEKDG